MPCHTHSMKPLLGLGRRLCGGRARTYTRQASHCSSAFSSVSASSAHTSQRGTPAAAHGGAPACSRPRPSRAFTAGLRPRPGEPAHALAGGSARTPAGSCCIAAASASRWRASSALCALGARGRVAAVAHAAKPLWQAAGRLQAARLCLGARVAWVNNERLQLQLYLQAAAPLADLTSPQCCRGCGRLAFVGARASALQTHSGRLKPHASSHMPLSQWPACRTAQHVARRPGAPAAQRRAGRRARPRSARSGRRAAARTARRARAGAPGRTGSRPRRGPTWTLVRRARRCRARAWSFGGRAAAPRRLRACRPRRARRRQASPCAWHAARSCCSAGCHTPRSSASTRPAAQCLSGFRARHARSDTRQP